MENTRFCLIIGFPEKEWKNANLTLLPKHLHSSESFLNYNSGICVAQFDPKEPITLERCKEIVFKLEEAYKIKFYKIKLEDSIFEGKAEKGDWDNPLPLLKEKHYIYHVKSNCLTIWENGMPIYENNDGVICDDPVALADCLM